MSSILFLLFHYFYISYFYYFHYFYFIFNTSIIFYSSLLLFHFAFILLFLIFILIFFFHFYTSFLFLTVSISFSSIPLKTSFFLLVMTCSFPLFYNILIVIQPLLISPWLSLILWSLLNFFNSIPRWWVFFFNFKSHILLSPFPILPSCRSVLFSF